MVIMNHFAWEVMSGVGFSTVKYGEYISWLWQDTGIKRHWKDCGVITAGQRA